MQNRRIIPWVNIYQLNVVFLAGERVGQLVRTHGQSPFPFQEDSVQNKFRSFGSNKRGLLFNSLSCPSRKALINSNSNPNLKSKHNVDSKISGLMSYRPFLLTRAITLRPCQHTGKVASRACKPNDRSNQPICCNFLLKGLAFSDDKLQRTPKGAKDRAINDSGIW